MKQLRYIAGLWLTVLATAWAVLLSTGCKSEPVWQDLPGTPTGGTNSAAARTNSSASSFMMTNYVDLIHVGDVLVVTAAGVASDAPFPAYSENVKEDGTITPPQVGAVKAAGKMVGQLQKELQKDYEKIYRNITITVRIGDRYFYVDGEVNKRGASLYLGETDIISAIAAAGGFTDFANKKQVRLIHPNNRIEVIDYGKAILDSRKYPVYPNDKIHVKRRFW